MKEAEILLSMGCTWVEVRARGGALLVPQDGIELQKALVEEEVVSWSK